MANKPNAADTAALLKKTKGKPLKEVKAILDEEHRRTGIKYTFERTKTIQVTETNKHKFKRG